ncbi:hypothetical protein HG15A2_40810 [Adhaeretor mobilis]|uniref:Uncharacterized protein n=1 Tax=Adhaeretor mobilis TaxID=1930276 RepID=A0A517N0S5_9BACT|nr:hypothetical protein HG15A2_40810 [Adhaeretor mobilis]
MAIPHPLPWILLVGLVLFARPEATRVYRIFLRAILVIDGVSLLFDTPVAVKWIQGGRNVAGRKS